MIKEDKIGGLCRYEVENDLRTLRNANKVRKDSKRLGAVKKLLQEEVGALQQLAEENKEGLGAEYK